MTKEEAITLLCEHFSEGLVRTIVDAIAEDEREECVRECKKYLNNSNDNIRKTAFKCIFDIQARGQE
jgi:hypothetical protein